MSNEPNKARPPFWSNPRFFMAGLDARGHIVDPNLTWEEKLGWHAQVIEGLWLPHIVEDPDKEKTLALLRRCLERSDDHHRPEPVEVRIRRSDGSLRWLELSIDAYDHPRSDAVAWLIASDITEQRQLRTRLETANDERATAERTRAAFLANVSHEIRTPMNGIIGVLELLSNTHLAPEQLELVGIIDESANALLALINDLLEVSRIEAHGVELQEEPYAPRDLMEDICLLFASHAQEKGISLAWSCSKQLPKRIVGDSRRLRQVLTNLAHNAIKFTDRGEVKLFSTATILPEAGIRWKIGVRDTGAGIAPEDLEDIMEPFVQTEAGSKAGGTGLGLSIARQLIEKMGGRFEVESEVGVGSAFFATFDLCAEQIAEEASSPELIAPEVWILSFDPPPLSLLDGLAAVGATAHVVQDASELPAFAGDHTFIFAPWQDGLGKLKLAQDHLLPIYWIEQGEFPPMEHAYLSLPVRQRALAYAMDGMLHGSSTILDDEQVITITMHPSSLMEGSSVWSEVIEDNRLLKATTGGSTLTGMTAGAQVRILLVEDQSVNRRVAIQMLETLKLGFDIVVQTANDGAQAVEIASRERFDLILMDCSMPVMDGYEASRRIRALPSKNADIPIVALTAYALPEERQRALDAGMNEHITKPLTLDVLRKTLEEHLDVGSKSSTTDTAWQRPRTDLLQDMAPTPKPARPERKPPEVTNEALERFVRDLGDADLAREIIEEYLEDASARLLRIRELIRERPTLQREELSREAHTIKGSSKIFGLEPIIDAAHFFEGEAKVASREELALHVSTLEVCLLDARVRLEKFLARSLGNAETT